MADVLVHFHQTPEKDLISILEQLSKEHDGIQKSYDDARKDPERKYKALTFVTGVVMRHVQGKADPDTLRSVVGRIAMTHGVSDDAIRRWQQMAVKTNAKKKRK
jgi:hypothetical protein